MENKTNDFTIVTHKITSAIRENSLFHFVREQGSTVTCLSAYHLEESETETRHVLYFKPHTAITTESFRGAAPNNEHLSIDKFFSRENARYANGFGPAHWTVSYDDFRLHIYFSDNGDILNYHVKQDSNESDVELTPIEKKQIWAQAQPIQTMLQEIIKQKQQTYVQLQSELFEQERKLLRLTSKEQYYQQGQDYLAQVEKLNRYSDIVEVRQSLHINKLINRLEQNAELTVTPAEPSAPEATASIQEAITAPSTISQKPKKESKLAILKNQLREKADTLRLTATPYEQASLLAKIDDVALDILFESSSKNAKRTSKKFIETLKKQLPITLDTLTQQFQDKLKSGDVTYVLENYDSLSWQVNMRAMMDDFIKQLAEIPPSAAQLQIANYLYQNSQYYRSALFVKGISCTSCSWDKFSGEGLLVKCMRKQNLDAFKLFLEQGVSVNSYQMLYNAVAISALQAITLQSAGKEEALAVPYAKA
nr:hypothetical protein [Gammaproteobacteria bacterium]